MNLYRVLILIFLSTQFLYPLDYSIRSDSSKSFNMKNKRKYNIQFLVGDKPIIDGNLNDYCWKGGNWEGDFTQWIPNEGAKPSQKTELKITYDEENIYVAIRAYDKEPNKINIQAGRRDEFQGDMVGISFDSYHDHRTAFEFDLTAAGQKVDLLLFNSSWDVSWNAVWKGEVAFEDSAWTAEFEIPLSQLRFSDDELQIWGMHCWRWIDRLQEESDWEPQSSKGPGIIFQFGELHGLKNLNNAPPIEIVPYILGDLNTFKKIDNNPYKNKGFKISGNLGVDAKIGLSNNFTLDLTLNPDFGQVEADPSVMNLTAFETFYEEKRPFFLEGKNIFDFEFDGSKIFYSRRIGQKPSFNPILEDNKYIDYPNNTTIISSMKLSGKTSNGLSIGVLHSLTAKEFAEISNSQTARETEVEPLTNYFVLRVQKDYEEGNTSVGGIATSTNRFIKNMDLYFLNDNAFSGGLDFIHRWKNKEYYIDAKVIGSHLNGMAESMIRLQKSSARYFQRIDAPHLSFSEDLDFLSGYGGSIKVGKGSGGNWKYSTELIWKSPGLELNDLGYVNNVDLIKLNNSLTYFVTKSNTIFRTYNISVGQFNKWDFGINFLSSGFTLNTYSEFLNKFAISTFFRYTSEKLDNRILRGGYGMILPSDFYSSLYFRTDPSKKIIFQTSIDFSKADEKQFEYLMFQHGISYMPTNTLKFSISANYYKNYDELQYVTTEKVNDKDEYILGKISQKNLGLTFRIDYNITTELSIQYYGSPFISIGKYSNFKIVTDSKSDNYLNRTDDLELLEIDGIYNSVNFPTENISFRNPDYNFFEFRSNLVLRWEYMPGSQIYVIWSQERNNYISSQNTSISNAYEKLAHIYPANIFLIKLNYWLNL